MSLATHAVAGAVGFLVGVGSALFYLRWRMMSQIGEIEEQMNSMMELSEEMRELEEEADQST